MPAAPEFDLSGRVAVVTGAGRSIGKGAALALAEAGADVVLAGRTLETLETTADAIARMGHTALPIVCDVSEDAAVEELIAKSVENLGKVDVLVANAGVFQTWLPAEEVTAQEWDRVLSVNLRGAMLCCQHVGKHLIERGSGGSIVTIASIQGLVGIGNTVAYTASKHGLIGMMKTMAIDWAPHGIRVNAIAPGFIERDVEPLQQNPEMVQFVTSGTPLGRWGTTRELALAVLFLASPAASYVTGTTLAVDGGWTAV